MQQIKADKPKNITKKEASASLDLLDSVAMNTSATRQEHLRYVYAINYLRAVIDELKTNA